MRSCPPAKRTATVLRSALLPHRPSSTVRTTFPLPKSRYFRTLAHPYEPSLPPLALDRGLSSGGSAASPQERHRLLYLRSRRKRAQKWGCRLNPFHGSEGDGYGDPQNMSPVELVEACERA